MMELGELKPCPFCGDLAHLYSSATPLNGSMGHRIECQGRCRSKTCWWHSKDEAIAAWNNRPALEAALLRISEQRKVLFNLAIAAGKLNVALDGMEAVREQREDVLKEMRAAEAVLSPLGG